MIDYFDVARCNGVASANTCGHRNLAAEITRLGSAAQPQPTRSI